ncbi:hypothetical protein [Novosphingobium sp. MD-1]|uniref:hypothetical protein n=1 Tax=Novosphingobium sp. MD-1 TaxID=1630648 RepID=UPI000F7F4AB3|nr:hypothetical protein [Novosphingobium sp. MD-1]
MLQGLEAGHETAPSFIFWGEAASGGLQRSRKHRRSAPMAGQRTLRYLIRQILPQQNHLAAICDQCVAVKSSQPENGIALWVMNMCLGLNENAWPIAVFSAPQSVLRDQNVKSAKAAPLATIAGRKPRYLGQRHPFSRIDLPENLGLGAMANS